MSFHIGTFPLQEYQTRLSKRKMWHAWYLNLNEVSCTATWQGKKLLNSSPLCCISQRHAGLSREWKLLLKFTLHAEIPPPFLHHFYITFRLTQISEKQGEKLKRKKRLREDWNEERGACTVTESIHYLAHAQCSAEPDPNPSRKSAWCRLF